MNRACFNFPQVRSLSLSLSLPLSLPLSLSLFLSLSPFSFFLFPSLSPSIYSPISLSLSLSLPLSIPLSHSLSLSIPLSLSLSLSLWGKDGVSSMRSHTWCCVTQYKVTSNLQEQNFILRETVIWARPVTVKALDSHMSGPVTLIHV